MGFEKFEEKMKGAGCTQAAIDAFRVNYEQLTGGATGMVTSNPLACFLKCRWMKFHIAYLELACPSSLCHDSKILGYASEQICIIVTILDFIYRPARCLSSEITLTGKSWHSSIEDVLFHAASGKRDRSNCLLASPQRVEELRRYRPEGSSCLPSLRHLYTWTYSARFGFKLCQASTMLDHLLHFKARHYKVCIIFLVSWSMVTEV